MAEESSERRSKQRSASGVFCLAEATTDSSCATSAPNRDSGMGSPPPLFAMGWGRRECVTGVWGSSCSSEIYEPPGHEVLRFGIWDCGQILIFDVKFAYLISFNP